MVPTTLSKWVILSSARSVPGLSCVCGVRVTDGMNVARTHQTHLSPAASRYSR